MPMPGDPGNIVPQGDARTARRFEDLERQIRELRSMLVDRGNLTVPDGSGITIAHGGAASVIDGAGNTVATLGTVAGVTDVHAQDPASGLVMPLAQLAFGAVGANDGGTSLTQTTINTWQAGPMSLTVEVKTGRLYVEAGAVITVVGSASSSTQAVFSWALAGPTTVAASVTRGYGAGVVNPASPVVPGFGQGSRGYLHTGLTPGTYTITDQYQTNISGSSYVGRSLIAIPF